jgi:Holliday junction resolvase RusA-like endonuclease
VPEVSFTVYGTPAPQGSKRYVGNGIMVESSGAVRPWRQAVAEAWREAGSVHLFGAVEMEVTFDLARPAGHYKADGTLRPNARAHPYVRPDLDKLLRSTLDALSKDSMAVLDDARIVAVAARKRYADAPRLPGAVIVLRELGAGR